MSARFSWRTVSLVGLMSVSAWLGCGPAVHANEELSRALNQDFDKGDLKGAEQRVRRRLEAAPNDADAQFASGVVRLLQGIEQLGQAQYRHGAFNDVTRGLPVFRMPVPENPKPEVVSYQKVRQTFLDFQAAVVAAEAELAKVDVTQDVKLRLDFAGIRLDLTGDGRIGEGESFLQVAGIADRRIAVGSTDAYRVAFDAGDVPWLRGYCHFLAAFCDMVLAYDHQRLFDYCGQLVYTRIERSDPALAKLDIGPGEDWSARLADAIAAIHLMNFPCIEPDRMKSAHEHLLAMIRTSRESWALILAETDNDDEWLPNPKQTGRLQIPVTQEMIDSWHGVLAEIEAILQGEKLIPFWRVYARWIGPSTQIPARGPGVNLKRFFLEPREFDLVLIIQGSGVLPYVEEGQLSRPETWNNLQRVFGGQFFGFAAWFN